MSNQLHAPSAYNQDPLNGVKFVVCLLLLLFWVVLYCARACVCVCVCFV